MLSCSRLWHPCVLDYIDLVFWTTTDPRVLDYRPRVLDYRPPCSRVWHPRVLDYSDPCVLDYSARVLDYGTPHVLDHSNLVFWATTDPMF